MRIYYPGLRPPVEGFAFFSSSLGRVKASFSLRSFFRQIHIEGEFYSANHIVASSSANVSTISKKVVLLPRHSEDNISYKVAGFPLKGALLFSKLLCLLPYITNPALLLVIKMGMIAGIIGDLGNLTTITFYLFFICIVIPKKVVLLPRISEMFKTEGCK